MKKEIEKRVIKEADFILSTGETVRGIAKVFGVSKSTVHNDVSKKLQKIDFALYQKVQKILAKNFAEKHIRGGQSTKEKFLKTK